MTKALIQGFLEFREKAYNSNDGVMPDLVKHGQSPSHFIVSCIDSRANPGTVFNASPGKFFSHKAMGAIVRPYKHGTALAAALQFALIYNKVETIIVLGHTGCGAVKALIDNIDDSEIASFVDVASEGLNAAKKLTTHHSHHNDLNRHAEEQIILQSAHNLKSYPSVSKALKENRVEIRPWLFDMSAGDLLEYNYEEKNFISLIETKETNA